MPLKPGGRYLGQWLVFEVALTAVAGVVYLVVPVQDDSKTASPANSERGTAAPDDQMIAMIPVEGMSCSACAARVKGTLKDIDGVADVEVNLAERNVRVRYEAEKVTLDRLAAVINELGYKAHISTVPIAEVGEPNSAPADVNEDAPVATVTIPIDGMACEYCAQTVKETLARLDRVKDVGARLRQKEATVQYVEGKITPQRLTEEINAAGFKAGTPTSEGG